MSELTAAPPVPNVVYSGWWRRGTALLIDYVLVALVVAISFTLAFVIDYAPVSVPLIVLGVLTWGLGPFVYTMYFHATRGQTIGKRLLRIRVQHSEREGLIGYRAAFSRSALMWAFGLLVVPAFLDYLWPLWDEQNQAWHDKYAKSVVVRV